MTAHNEAPTLDTEYPNLAALSQGGMSGQFSEWPQLKVEADKILERLRAIENAPPENPCNCVPDGDDGTVAHLCHWHKQMFGKAYLMQNVANTLTVERIAKLPQDRLRLWIAHGIQESTARKRAEEQLAELQRKHDGLVRAAEMAQESLARHEEACKGWIDDHHVNTKLAPHDALAKLNGGDR